MYKRVLVLGMSSYIGIAIEKYLKKSARNYFVDRVSTRNDGWKKIDFFRYDVVIDVAGIAHIKVKPYMKNLFYSINRDMTISMCKKAKREGVTQFIFLSSMNVYGDTVKLITQNTKPKPKNFYGDSKLQADIEIQKMNSDTFKVASIRPPFVYGKMCKGNYKKLSKLARLLPIFPNYVNQRSVIYIDNLCEFIRLLIEDHGSGIYHPQNKEYTSTLEMAICIAQVHKHKVYITGLFNFLIKIMLAYNNSLNRAFSDDRYDMKLSSYKSFKYCVVNFQESIRNSEGV